jgi:deferrochelatase/peroxidase EfeB
MRRLILINWTGTPVTTHGEIDGVEIENAKTMNNFVYGEDRGNGCPYGAHTRKMNTRSGTGNVGFKDQNSRIIRNGIPYGSEYNKDDTGDSGQRGLIFACYQSSIECGFQNLQTEWSNNPGNPSPSGHDPIIGHQKNGKLSILLIDGEGNKKKFTMSELVAVKGGEYFFVPSITALQNQLSQD